MLLVIIVEKEKLLSSSCVCGNIGMTFSCLINSKRGKLNRKKMYEYKMPIAFLSATFVPDIFLSDKYLRNSLRDMHKNSRRSPWYAPVMFFRF